MPVVNVHALAFAYPSSSRLFENVTFRLARGAKAALVGANGAGKSTLLRLLRGRLRPDAGSVAVCGTVATVAQTDSDADDADAFGGAFVRNNANSCRKCCVVVIYNHVPQTSRSVFR